MRTRLKDVASKLNLSPALVSGVLNNRPHIWASDETKARIIAAAAALHYHPSATAQALSRGTTQSVLFVYRRLQGFAYRLAYSGLVDALSAELQSAGYDLVVSNFATQEAVVAHLQKVANSQACDGVVLWGREADTEPQGELLEELNIPFVVKGRHEVNHPKWHQIDYDHEGMMGRAVEHVVSLGHDRIAYLGFPYDEGYVKALRLGFLEAHQRCLGIEARADWVQGFEDEVAPNASQLVQWMTLARDERPTAFVVGAGNMAWQAIEICLAQEGHQLVDGAGEFAAAGITSSPFSLMFGSASVYQGIEIDNLVGYATPGLIRALNREPLEHPIQRFLPDLGPAASFRLVDHGVALRREAAIP